MCVLWPETLFVIEDEPRHYQKKRKENMDLLGNYPCVAFVASCEFGHHHPIVIIHMYLRIRELYIRFGNLVYHLNVWLVTRCFDRNICMTHFISITATSPK